MFFFFFYFYFKNKKIKKAYWLKKRQAFQDWELKIRKHRIAVRASTPKKALLINTLTLFRRKKLKYKPKKPIEIDASAHQCYSHSLICFQKKELNIWINVSFSKCRSTFIRHKKEKVKSKKAKSPFDF